MTYSLYLQLQMASAQLLVGQDNVPDPAKGKDPKKSDGKPANDDKPLDGFFPTQPKDSDKAKDGELEKALGTSTPTSVRTTLDELKAIHLGEHSYFYLKDEGVSYGDSIYLLPDNRILRLASSPTDLRIYVYDTNQKKWVEIGSRTSDPANPYTNLQVSAGIKDILESRRTRNWVSPPSKKVLELEKAKRYSDEVWLCGCCGNPFYILPDGKVTCLNKDGSKVYIYDGDNWKILSESETSKPEVKKGIDQMKDVRIKTNWKPPSK